MLAVAKIKAMEQLLVAGLPAPLLLMALVQVISPDRFRAGVEALKSFQDQPPQQS
jgi:hypothetical protein